MTGLNEGLLPEEQREDRGGAVRAVLGASTKGCSRRSSGWSVTMGSLRSLRKAPQRRAAPGGAAGVTRRFPPRDDVVASTKGCSRKSSGSLLSMVTSPETTPSPQRRAALGRAAGWRLSTATPTTWPSLNEGLLSEEQRVHGLPGGGPHDRASTKGCSRKSSGRLRTGTVPPGLFTPQRRAALGRAAGAQLDQPRPRPLLVASTKGCSRKSSGPSPAGLRGRTYGASLNEGLLSEEQRAGTRLVVRWRLVRLNEGLLSEEQRVEALEAAREEGAEPQRRAALGRAAGRGVHGRSRRPGHQASTKGCSRKSSGCSGS